MARLLGQKAINKVVSHVEGVHHELGDVARRIKGNAEARLAIHRQTGSARVTLTEGETDWLVNLEDNAALSIEFGHVVKGKYETDPPKFAPGLYILTGAAGLENIG
ncbi:DUF5403 family protein [Segniliparus rugosus]|uniref:Uncharacterized protein n=1 Tax=Segniliparus rugosus (strain ATCC BAA-974 / DSM 45345 / CCUG 50838 / CIP 108380 / JCM 13579 / CDC 945) TaxID=679197 RepID=E5XRT0_SEGRC|nr:DUF5403 family protein [Segniliparus rugosus]EFV12945.1 hypothetical protein HMPREF9336_02202 [Segniliparus rugosus ATCC BAA-974]